MPSSRPIYRQRLPSGKFDTHDLARQLAALAMNLRRLMGQRGLRGRIKTVIPELICRAARLIASGRRLIRGAGRQ